MLRGGKNVGEREVAGGGGVRHDLKEKEVRWKEGEKGGKHDRKPVRQTTIDLLQHSFDTPSNPGPPPVCPIILAKSTV